MLYLIQITIYSFLLWLIYLLLLRNKPMHHFNRGYLLMAVVLPLVLPLVKLPGVWQTKLSETVSYQLPAVLVGERGSDATTMESTSVWAFVAYGYLAVVFMLLLFQLRRFYLIRNVIRKSKKEQYQHYTVLKNTDYGPGSWGKYIFLPDEETNPTILAHEQAHIELKHTQDLLLLQFLQILFWPNILIPIIKRELVQVHEFQADSMVNMNSDDYSQMLLSSVFSTCTLPLSHSFIIHPVKRRIMMLKNKNGSRKSTRLVAVFSLLLLAGSIVAVQSCNQEKKEAVQPEVVRDVTTLSKMAECPFDLTQYMIDHVNYPKEASAQGIEGKINVQFVIDEQGNPTQFKVLNKDPNPLLAKAALDALEQMPKWTPAEKDGERVPVYFTLPVSFQLPPEDMPEVEASDIPENEKVSRTVRRG